MKGENSDWCYDHYINYRAMKQAKDIRDQLLNIIAKQKKSLLSNPMGHPDYSQNIRKAILSGYFMQVGNL
jgi:pre-mRNA-splicing factor ATP-dependent RNA helicase DHX15/PRP43